jgi:hypothetical protein
VWKKRFLAFLDYNKRRKKMKSKNQTTIFMTVLALILAFALPALSEDKWDDEMQVLIEKLRVDKRILVAETMKLTESEARAFWPVYESYQDERIKLGKRLIKGIKTYADNYGKISDNDAKSLRREYLAILYEELRIMESYMPKFEEALPEKKVFRYFQIERTWEAAVDAMLSKNIPLIQ